MARLLYAIVVGLVVLAVIEAACRFLYPDDIELVRNPDHRLRPNSAETNADGIRMKREAREFTEDAVNVVFLGDSFVFGGREYPQLALPAQLEAVLRARHPTCAINVANFGWVSSSPYLSLRLLRDIGRKYSPDLVLLGLDMTDFHDDLKYRLLLERPTLTYKAARYLPGVIVVSKKALNRLARFQWARRAHERIFSLPSDPFLIVNQPLRESEPLTAPIVKSVRDIATFTHDQLRAKFALIVFPRSFQYSTREAPNSWERNAYTALGPYALEPFVLFDELRRNVDFPIYSLLRDFQTTSVFPTVLYDDPHWTEKGTRFVAERVSEIVEKEHVLDCAQPAPGLSR